MRHGVKINHFEKRDVWTRKFYSIIENEKSEKILWLRGVVGYDNIDTLDGDEDFVWFHYIYPRDYSRGLLTDVLEFGYINYGIDKYILKGYNNLESLNYIVHKNPQDAYYYANEFVKGYFKEGSIFLPMYKIDDYIEVGDYFD